MALALLFLAGHMADYVAKILLLVYLWREPSLSLHFGILMTAHVLVGIRKAFVLCCGPLNVPCCAAPMLVLLLGVASPLLQVVHLFDAVAAWWCRQDIGKRLPLRSAPLDSMFEGLVFMLTSLHLRLCLALGRCAPPQGVAQGSFETLIMGILCSSLITVAVSMVLIDSTLSLKLSRAMYGPTSPHSGKRGKRCGSTFASQLAYRGCEVAAKSAIVICFAFMFQPSYFAGYLAAIYVVTVGVLVGSSQEATSVGSAMVIAWPVLFANLTQFVDAPKHCAAAQSAANLVCGLRAMELSVALSLAVTAYLVEEEIGKTASSGWLSDPQTVQVVTMCQTLFQRTSSLSWATCFSCVFMHYICMVVRWCGVSSNPLTVPLLSDHSGMTAPSTAGAAVSGNTGGITAPADVDVMPDKDFWPPAPSLAPLLLAAACERAPFAWPMSRSAPAAGSSKSGPSERLPCLEDFDTIGLIGYGEFGKVFQVRRRATQETFAIKRLSKEFYARRQMTDKAVREIATLNLAQEHPFVVRLVHALETASEWAMVMEYCPGGDLQQLLLTEGCPGLPLQRTLRISAEVALALEHLHTRGIVFRDLKLENVVLDQDGFAQLTDFGLAKQYRGGRDAVAEAQSCGNAYAAFTKTFCGSYGYAAPEVNPRRQVHGFAADLYAYGVLLFMMLTGGEVYHDTREAPFERRLPPESLKDLRSLLSSIKFDFYWASHHLLQPARAKHRVEIDLNGAVVIVSRGQRGARRQPRPHRPPNTIRGLDQAAFVAAGQSPLHFPELACSSSEASRRRWDLALDLVRALTDEAPERRGTVASLKEHPFFEEIGDWRFVLPARWIVNLVKAKLTVLTGRSNLPERLLQHLRELPLQVLVSLLDRPEDAVRLMEQFEELQVWSSPGASVSSPGLTASPDPLLLRSPPHAGSPPHEREAQGASLSQGAGALSARSEPPLHEWRANYP
eukprot:TRINITY_DN93064_c0_g1_i1.p1 TRINITY_DN93064_c0_g1~~TRINITY_DN93064_c0_g1_i1.p1  ORF type:complete len:956 (-),score=165.68 TRINITY_DN93064_c0_g1_i1:64-2931(-)